VSGRRDVVGILGEQPEDAGGRPLRRVGGGVPHGAAQVRPKGQKHRRLLLRIHRLMQSHSCKTKDGQLHRADGCGDIS